MTPRRVELVVRSAEERDVDAVQRVAREAWEATFGGLVGRVDRQQMLEHMYSRRSLLEDIGRHSSLFFVATVEDAVVGFGEFVLEGRTGEVARVAVRPEWQRRGIASALLQRGLAVFAQEGVETVTAAVEPQDEGCRQLFERHGFRSSGEPLEDLEEYAEELAEYRRDLADASRLAAAASEATVWVDDGRRSCPRCHRSFDPGVATCPDCGVSLVAEAPRRQRSRTEEAPRFVTVVCTSDESRLSFVQSALEGAGILFAVHRETNGGGDEEVVEVQVARSQADEAREVLDGLEEEQVEATGEA